jgi:hypothetical protein
LTMYTLDLEQEISCEKRRDVVAKLRAIGDSKAIPALERARSRLGRSGKWNGKPVNQCLIDDATSAISYLSSLPGAEPTTAVPGRDETPAPTPTPPQKTTKPKSPAKRK